MGRRSQGATWYELLIREVWANLSIISNYVPIFRLSSSHMFFTQNVEGKVRVAGPRIQGMDKLAMVIELGIIPVSSHPLSIFWTTTASLWAQASKSSLPRTYK